MLLDLFFYDCLFYKSMEEKQVDAMKRQELSCSDRYFKCLYHAYNLKKKNKKKVLQNTELGNLPVQNHLFLQKMLCEMKLSKWLLY